MSTADPQPTGAPADPGTGPDRPAGQPPSGPGEEAGSAADEHHDGYEPL
jgi:hypothetical protein